jgi:hypothetical protein
VSTTFNDFPVVARPLSPAAAIDGLPGLDFFRNQELTIDFPDTPRPQTGRVLGLRMRHPATLATEGGAPAHLPPDGADEKDTRRR